ncbi:hypothetical protein BS50DRAFT_109300 [Corynespora cassiicola Philippines]|uniref:Uncharacterized protein n=1 Tax=Corynespora cassiicola Philippines TaxID=1448308 RepID=A0A2T2NCZ7_CORCC|nr:hypothetical protein BS50DRAFT_109300 [Corynespora cassiicola Philippines]
MEATPQILIMLLSIELPANLVEDEINFLRTIKRFWGNYETFSVRKRVEIIQSIQYGSFSESSRVRLFCNIIAPNDGILTKNIIKEAIQEGSNLLVPVSYQWGISFGATERRPLYWSDMIRTIIKQRDTLATGSFLHIYPWDLKNEFLYSTPLSSMVRGMVGARPCSEPRCDIQTIQKGIFDFLELLLACGIDLVWYGKEVKKQMHRKLRLESKTGETMWEHITCSILYCDYNTTGHGYWNLPVTLSNFEYGPSAKDWKFFWEDDYGCLQVFWELVEWQAETELDRNIGGIPGAWPQGEKNFRVLEDWKSNLDLL